MWELCLSFSVGCLLLASICSFLISRSSFAKRHKFNLFNSLFAGVFVAALFAFFPVHRVMAESGEWGEWQAILLSLFNTMQIFALGCEFGVVSDGMLQCPAIIDAIYRVWIAVLFVLAPIFTFGFVLSLFKNISEYFRYLLSFFKETFVFSELNERSLALASDIKRNHPKAAIVFTDVFEGNDERSYELVKQAQKIDAITFKKDILVINFNGHSSRTGISFFAIAYDETENLNQALKLIETYRKRKNTRVYVFSTKVESEILLTSIDKGEMKVRRINEVQSLVNRILFERGEILFDSAKEGEDGSKHISALVIGMGRHGTEMTKALAWFGQMDGYTLEINAFDRDPLAEEKFICSAPELMSEKYNGVTVDGEAQYKISIHPGIDVETSTFAEEIAKLGNTTYVLVALGNDDVNINTAIRLRMYFERMKIYPVIHSIVYNSQQKNALSGAKNYRGQPYDIEFIGDMESSYTEDVIIDSALEEDALRRHLKWGKEEEFWAYEYNYRSSVASAIHMAARIKCGIPGTDKREEELSAEERHTIEVLEHRRWNAYMRAEGYVFSGSKDKSSRNDLAKMHHDLVDFSSLTEEEKRKDGKVGAK